MSDGNAKKFDEKKPKLSMIPIEGLTHEAHAFEYGAKKYAKRNFEKGIEWSRLIDASLRHIYAFAGKEDIDPESLTHHLGCARANLSMLLYNIEHKVGKDDR